MPSQAPVVEEKVKIHKTIVNKPVLVRTESKDENVTSNIAGKKNQ